MIIIIGNRRRRKELKLLNEILAEVKALKQDDKVAELEKQMDSWLVRLKQALGNLETVSDKVDSK